MKRFFEDSSQAKNLSPDKSIHKALRYFSKKPLSHYELRDYSKSPYFVINTFISKDAAIVAREFHILEQCAHFAVVAVDPFTSEFNRG